MHGELFICVFIWRKVYRLDDILGIFQSKQSDFLSCLHGEQKSIVTFHLCNRSKSKDEYREGGRERYDKNDGICDLRSSLSCVP